MEDFSLFPPIYSPNSGYRVNKNRAISRTLLYIKFKDEEMAGKAVQEVNNPQWEKIEKNPEILKKIFFS